jgi:hypothetical protein
MTTSKVTQAGMVWRIRTQYCTGGAGVRMGTPIIDSGNRPKTPILEIQYNTCTVSPIASVL